MWKEVEASCKADRYYNTMFAGKQAGSVKKDTGYRYIQLEGRCIRAHRLAWYMYYGEWPADGEDIDHINHIRDDNRITNLRKATRYVQMQTKAMASNNTSGCTGVIWLKNKRKWRAGISFNGKVIHIGTYENLDDAIKARKDCEKRLGFSPTHGVKIND